MGVCTHTLRFVFLQLKVLLYHGVTLSPLPFHRSFASAVPPRCRESERILAVGCERGLWEPPVHVLTSAYTEIFEGQAAPEARTGTQAAVMLAALRCHLPPPHFAGN